MGFFNKRIVSLYQLCHWRNLTFCFREGDKVGVVRTNGAGKSTLLRGLAGIYEPTSGSIAVNGKIVSMLSIGVGLNPEASGLENIYLLGLLMGYRRNRMRKYADDIAEFSELGEFLYVPVRTYSSGMKMRLNFSVATTVDADILLLDEWLSVGDKEFKEKAAIRLNSLIEKVKIVVLASQNENIIKKNCNWIMKLDKGEIISIEKNVVIA